MCCALRGRRMITESLMKERSLTRISENAERLTKVKFNFNIFLSRKKFHVVIVISCRFELSIFRRMNHHNILYDL